MGVALFGCNNQAVMETSDIKLFANNLIGAYDKDTGKIGFIDSTGQYVIEPQYDNIIRTFDETKTASVVKDDMYMTINESGKQLHNKKYGLFNGYTLHNGYNTNNAQLIDSNGNIVFESESGKLRYTTGNEYISSTNPSMILSKS